MTTAIKMADAEGDRPGWLGCRAGGVTATDVHALAQGGASTRKRINDEKDNGSKFGGTADTERGKRREPILAEWIERRFGIAPNRWLYAQAENPQYLATPDGLGTVSEEFGGGEAGAEIKSHDHGWEPPASIVPADHYDQCQWGMFVTGTRRWLYVWEVIEADGYPPMQPEFVWIERDEDRIATLRDEADRFLAWRAAGAPLIDVDIDPELDEAISAHVKARVRKNAAAADEKAAETIIRARIDKGGAKHSGSDGQLVYAVTDTPVTQTDWAKWEADDPTGLARFRRARELVDQIEAAALMKYPTTSVVTTTKLTIAAHKTEKA